MKSASGKRPPDKAHSAPEKKHRSEFKISAKWRQTFSHFAIILVCKVTAIFAQAFCTPTRPFSLGQLSNERSRGFGSFRVPLCRRTRRVVSPARSVLSELLLFRELQTIVSAVAFAKGTRGKPVGSNALPKLACWL